MSAIVAIHTNISSGFFGHAADLSTPLAGTAVLQHTVNRAAQIQGVKAIVLLHPADQAPLDLLDTTNLPIPVVAQASELRDQATAKLTSARKWCLTGWRGGLGGATIFDEALPPGPILQAMTRQQVDSAVLLRGDWCLFDHALASKQLERHLEAPDQLPIVFSQSAPGLSAVACHRSALEQLAEHHAGFGQALGYNPKHAHGDPIGKDVCLPVPVPVRDAYQRFVFDTPGSRQLMSDLADKLGDRFGQVDAAAVVEAAASIDQSSQSIWQDARWATLELTPRRTLTGPITPQAHVPTILDRPDMADDILDTALERLGQAQCAPIIFGGLGDALLAPNWHRAISQARQAGVLGIGIETDLVCGPETIDALLEADVDVITVRVNADRADTYAKVNGQDLHQRVFANLHHLIEASRSAASPGTAWSTGTPWIVPKLVKTMDNLGDLESFYERWKTIAGHAVIERFATGLDAESKPLIEDQSPVNMVPPTPVKWPTDHLTVLSSGDVTLNPQDWLGLHAVESLAGAGV